MAVHWVLSDKSLQIFRILLSILCDLNNVVVWIVSTRPLISKPSSSLTKPLLSVPRPPMIFQFLNFFNSLARSRYFSVSFKFTVWSTGTANHTIHQVRFFLLNNIIFWPRLGDLFVSQNPVSFSGRGSGLCIYHLYE